MQCESSLWTSSKLRYLSLEGNGHVGPKAGTVEVDGNGVFVSVNPDQRMELILVQLLPGLSFWFLL
jgi:hypothetical protein